MPEVDINVIDFAIRMEEDGVSFYTKAAEMFKDKEGDLRKVFMKLAKDEAKHLQEILDLKDKALRKGIEESFTSVEVSEYLAAVVRDGLFPTGEDAAKKLEEVKTVEDACNIAIKAEKSAILLYMELARISKDKGQKKMLERMVDEEKTHLVRVTNLRGDYDPLFAVSLFSKC